MSCLGMLRSPSPSLLWRRLDQPGHDLCRLLRLHAGESSGWQLEGAAVFRHSSARHAHLTYRVHCDERWQTQRGFVRGWIGDDLIDRELVRHRDTTWTCDGAAVPGLSACVDLDLGFSPATNLLSLRRLALGIGATADVSAAWLDEDCAGLEELVQRYERRSETTYWYSAPRFAYAALLTITPDGFVSDYPTLWRAEP